MFYIVGFIKKLNLKLSFVKHCLHIFLIEFYFLYMFFATHKSQLYFLLNMYLNPTNHTQLYFLKLQPQKLP